MGGSGLSGGPSSKPARALGKAVVGTLLATAAHRFRDREAFFCAGTRAENVSMSSGRDQVLSHDQVLIGALSPSAVH
jgi:hypothetical protein